MNSKEVKHRAVSPLKAEMNVVFFLAAGQMKIQSYSYKLKMHN